MFSSLCIRPCYCGWSTKNYQNANSACEAFNTGNVNSAGHSVMQSTPLLVTPHPGNVDDTRHGKLTKMSDAGGQETGKQKQLIKGITQAEITTIFIQQMMNLHSLVPRFSGLEHKQSYLHLGRAKTIVY